MNAIKPSIKSRQIAPLVTSTLEQTKEKWADTDIYVGHKGLKPIDAYKILLSKFVYQTELCSEDDVTAVNLLYQRICEQRNMRMHKPISSINKFTERRLIDYINQSRDQMVHILESGLLSVMKRSNVIFSDAHQYFGRIYQRQIEITLSYQRRKSRNHPSRYIGVGYKDKGASQVSSWDGSPSWQQTATELSSVVSEKVTSNSYGLQVSRRLLNTCIFTLEDSMSCQNFTDNPVREHYLPYLCINKYGDEEIGYIKDRKELNIDYEVSFANLIRASKKLKLPFRPIEVDGKIGFLARNKLDKHSFLRV